MSDSVKLTPFPSDKYEALALLYVQSRDNLSSLTPEQIFDEYIKAVSAMRTHKSNTSTSKQTANY